jgi:hypothetical protein
MHMTHEALRDTIIQLRERYINDLAIPLDRINNGWCAEFAEDVLKELGGSPDGVTIHEDSELGNYDYSHTFLKFEGKFYDAEAPDGVEDWTRLPLFVQHPELLSWELRNRAA